MYKDTRMNYFFFVFLVMFLTGCSSALLVEPTREEMAAARQFKKTLAIIDIEDENSDVGGISPMALSKLEESLLPSFNLVERSRIDSILNERTFQGPDQTEDYAELGKLLNADYLAFGIISSSVNDPRIGSSIGKDKDGEFRGTIWHEYCGQNDTSLKIIEVDSGLIEYAESKSARDCRKTNVERYKDEGKYNKALALNMITQQIVRVAQSLTGLNKSYSAATLNSLDKSIHQIGKDLRRKFAQSGEILQILSKKEVLVNLGSAYGVKPGDFLVAYEEKEPIVDPKTGLEIIPKVKMIRLKVTKVTSGLTAVAKSGKKNITKLRVGDQIYTY